MNLAEQLTALSDFHQTDVILIDDSLFNVLTISELVHHPGQLLVINTELKLFAEWMNTLNLSNIIVATYDRDYRENVEIVKQLEAKKIGVLALKESPTKRASIESLLKTLASLQLKKITCLFSRNKLTEFLTQFNPSEAYIWQNNKLVAEKFIGANTLLPHLDLKLIVV